MAIFYQPPEPRQATPKVLPQTQGAQPNPTGPRGGSVTALTAVGVWATLAAVPMPVQKPLNVVPLTLRYGSQPAPQAPLSVTQTNVAVRSWDLPQQPPPALVTAVQGVAPVPVYVPFNPTHPAIGLWPQPDWRAQSEPEIAPLTLPRGDSVPFAPQQIGSIVISWPAQSAPQSAAWNVPVVVQTVVLNAPPRQVVWDSVRQEPPRPVAIATLTLARGDSVPFFRPPIFWPALDWPSQSEESNAGWNFVPPVVSQPIPYVRFRIHMVAPAIWWRAQFAPPVAAFANVLAIALDRAIAQSIATDSLVSGSSSSATLIQNSGTVSIISVDSRTIQLITGNSGVASIESDD